MITEDDVVQAVCAHLRSLGYTIERCLSTRERGSPDVIASKGEHRVLVEAKGGTSNRPGSGRYGQGFDSGQRVDHMGKALMVLLTLFGKQEAQLALALPASHAYLVAERQLALDALGIGAFLVDDAGRVIQGPSLP